MCFVEPDGVRWNTRVIHQGAALHRSPPVQLCLAPDRKQLLMRCESLLMIIGRHGVRDNSTVRKMRPEEGRGGANIPSCSCSVVIWISYKSYTDTTADQTVVVITIVASNCPIKNKNIMVWNGPISWRTNQLSISLTRVCICKLTGARGTLR